MNEIDTAAMREHYNAPAFTGRATPDIEALCDEIDALRAENADLRDLATGADERADAAEAELAAVESLRVSADRVGLRYVSVTMLSDALRSAGSGAALTGDDR